MIAKRKRFARRELLRWGAIAAGGLATSSLLGCGSESPADDDDTLYGLADAGVEDSGLCQATRADALGPFFESGAPERSRIASDDEPGDRLSLFGRVLDQDCTTPLGAVLIDVWQADKDGNYHDAGTEYRLRGQVLTDADGLFAIDTIKPGNYQLNPGIWRPAHIHLMFAKPGHQTVATQIYFAGDPYLAPADGCTTCGSDDIERIVSLEDGAGGQLQGSVDIVLARA